MDTIAKTIETTVMPFSFENPAQKTFYDVSFVIVQYDSIVIYKINKDREWIFYSTINLAGISIDQSHSKYSLAYSDFPTGRYCFTFHFSTNIKPDKHINVSKIIYIPQSDTGSELTKPSTNRISIFPNPITDILYIQNNNQTVSVSIYNLFGQKVLCTSTENAVNVSALSDGIYIVKIANDTEILHTTKLQKIGSIK